MHERKLKKIPLNLALLATFALAASTALAAEYCAGLFRSVDLDSKSKGLIKFLGEKNVEARIVGMEKDPEFSAFYRDIEAWMLGAKSPGQGSSAVSVLKRPKKHAIEATMILDEPGMVRIQLEVSDERGFFKRKFADSEMADTAAVLDAQAVQLALVGKLYSSFGADELKNLKLEWNLPKDAPAGLGKQLAALGFISGDVTKGCLLKKFGNAGIVLIAAGAAGYYAGETYDYAERYGEEPFETGLKGAGLIGGSGAILTFLMTCRKPTLVNGGYHLSFQRISKLPAPAKKTAAPSGAAAKKPTK